MNNLFRYITQIISDYDIRTRFLCDKNCIIIEYTELEKLSNKYNDAHFRFMKKLYGFNRMAVVSRCGTDDAIICEWDEEQNGFIVHNP